MGAVLHVQWMWDHYKGDDDLLPSEDDSLASGATCFRRVAGEWEQGNGTGGSGWYSPVLRT